MDGLNESIHSTAWRNRERYLLDREQRASNRAFVEHYRAAVPSYHVHAVGPGCSATTNFCGLRKLKSSRAPARKWHAILSSTFGVRGSIEQIFFPSTPLRGPWPKTISAGPVLPTRPARDLILDYARAIRRPVPILINTEPVSEPQETPTARGSHPEKMEENLTPVQERVPDLR
jgi:hypothetical protein